MAKMILIDPITLILPSDDENVKRFLTYEDKSVQFQLSRMKRNFRWKASDGESYVQQMNKLKAESKPCLLSYTPEGQPYTYSGLWKELQQRFGWELENHVNYPLPERDIPWAKVPFEMRYYQANSVKHLLEAKHGSISLPTGAGKSAVILNLCKQNPVRTVIMAPLAAIADGLYKQFVTHFGAKYVGKYGDGKKETKKLFTIAVAQSLTRIEEDSQPFQDFQDVAQVIFDESHTVPADTFEKVCMSLFSKAPYRFFVSATQIRNDGSEMLLKGIIGPIVYGKSFGELVNEGFLAKPKFKIFTVNSTYGVGKRDAKEETRLQLYRNPNVLALAGQVANHMVNTLGLQVVILIDEFKQFDLLKNHVTVPFKFAHGGASESAKESLASEYLKPDNEQIIKDFNAGQVRCLIGTSAISTGVDLVPTGAVIYLQGGTSEIKVCQGIGRGTRPIPGVKNEFFVVDFKVIGSDTMERHLEARREIYETLGEVVEH